MSLTATLYQITDQHSAVNGMARHPDLFSGSAPSADNDFFLRQMHDLFRRPATTGRGVGLISTLVLRHQRQVT